MIGALMALLGLNTYAQSGAPCPVTRADQGTSFVPPFPYPARAPVGSFWFGTERLWTQLPAKGRWVGLMHYTSGDPTFRQKLFFWKQGYDPRKDPSPSLSIKGVRLDAPASPLAADRANGGWTSDQSFMVTGINIPTLGCWEITARYQDDELRFVVLVAK